MFTKTAFLSQAMRKCLIKQHFKVKLWLLSIKDPKQVLIFLLIHYYDLMGISNTALLSLI